MGEQDIPVATVPLTVATLPELLSGKYVRTVVLADNTVGLAFAQTGDAYPRLVLWVHGASTGLYTGDGKSLPTAFDALPTRFQTGAGTPYGSVTPVSKGAIYQDTTNGGLWVAIGVTTTSWVIVAGAPGAGGALAPGLSISPDGLFLALQSPAADGGISITDAFASAGSGNALFWNSGAADGQQTLQLYLGPTANFIHTWNTDGTYALPAPASAGTHAPRLNQLSPKATITAGALPTQQLVTATAAQVSTTRDVEVHTPVTFNPGVATTATCVVALSPDNVTFSTLATVTKPVGTVFDGTIEDVVVRVPAGWYVKLTVTNATLGLSTYY